MASCSMLASKFLFVCFIVLPFIPSTEFPCEHLFADLGGTISFHGMDEDWADTNVLECYVHKKEYVKMFTVTGDDIQFTAPYEDCIEYLPSNNSFQLHQLTLSDEGWYDCRKNSKLFKCYLLNLEAKARVSEKLQCGAV